MSSAAVRTTGAREPAELYAVVEQAMNHADLDALVDAHDEHAVVVIPPDGTTASGHDELRAAMAALLALRPQLTMTPVRVLRTNNVAMTHGRWTLTLVDHGNRIDLAGHGTMVSRRNRHGTWRILLDDPLARL